MRKVIAILLTLAAVGLLSIAPGWVGAQSNGRSKSKAAVPPPKWKERKGVVEAFFADARKELQGERPDFTKKPGSGGGPASAGSEGGAAPAQGGDGFAWSKLISPDTIESEIKTSATAIAELVKTPGKFKSNDYKPARKHYSVVAVMFGVIARYDGDVRWKDKAAGLRDGMAKAGVNCKVGTDQSFNEAKTRSEDLTALVGGGKVSVPDSPDEPEWSAVSDRPPLMQRMETAGHEHLKPWLANKGEFTAKKDQVLREAEVLAVMAHVIKDPSFEFADDSGYQEYADNLEKGCIEIIEACKSDDYDRAAGGASAVTKACADCHSGFRG
jgi:hypothetical protein